MLTTTINITLEAPRDVNIERYNKDYISIACGSGVRATSVRGLCSCFINCSPRPR